jgi:hypothetical protein
LGDFLAEKLIEAPDASVDAMLIFFAALYFPGSIFSSSFRRRGRRTKHKRDISFRLGVHKASLYGEANPTVTYGYGL